MTSEASHAPVRTARFLVTVRMVVERSLSLRFIRGFSATLVIVRRDFKIFAQQFDYGAAQRDMPVDRGGAAGDLAPRVGNLSIRSSLGDQAPIMRPDGDPGVQEIVGTLRDRGIVRTGLDEQDAAVGVLAQSRRQRREPAPTIISSYCMSPPDETLCTY
jgi:hypothetical protein